MGCGDSQNPPSFPPPSNKSVPVRFDVTVPASTPCGATVAVIGNDPALGDGKPPGLALTRDVDGHFRGSVELPVRKILRYNFVLTNPDAQEPIASHNYIVEDRQDIERQWTVRQWSVAADESQTPISFVVEVPANTPSGAEIWLSGNQPELGNWNGAGVKLTKGSSGNRYGGCVPFAKGTHLEFKVTRGSWDSVEKDPQGQEIANHTHTVVAPAKVEVQVGSWRDLVP